MTDDPNPTDDYIADLDNANRENEDEYLAQIRRLAYRYSEDATITRVKGDCPYGHQEGDVFTLTNMNSDGMCGSLYHVIQPDLVTIHYGGGLLWHDDPYTFKGICKEGKVEVEAKRNVLSKPTVVRTKPKFVDMTGKGFESVDKYRIYLETISVANTCTWGHKEDQKIEIDIFNIGKACGFLYASIYQYIHLLLSGGGGPWEADQNIFHGCCPDPFNQVTYRLIKEERK